MKKFKYRLTLTIKILLILGLLVAGGCFVLQIIRFAKGNVISTYNYISAILCLVLSIAFIVVAISVLLSSGFTFTDKALKINWGIIKSEFPYSSIVRAVNFTKSGQFVMYLKDESYFVVYIDEKDYVAFAEALAEKNERITYEINTEEKRP